MSIAKDEPNTCICKQQDCWRGSEAGVPVYCQANRYVEELEATGKDYAKPEVVDLYEAACVVGARQ